MEPRDRHESPLTRYLLGTLAEAEQRRLEEAYFRDEALFGELLEVAEELAEAWKSGELSRSEREAFERRVLECREWRERLQATKGLERLASRARPDVPFRMTTALPTTSRPLRRPWALATLGTAALLGFLALHLLRSGTLRTPIPQEARPGPAVSGSSSHVTEAPVAPPVIPGRTVELALRTAIFRDGGEASVLHLEPGVAWVRLGLPVERDRYERYEAVLRTAEGTDVLTAPVERDTRAGRRLIAQVPAARLGPGDYILILKGSNPGKAVDDVADYYFRVASR
jgi:anti-sigma factor RsiW